MPAVFSSCRKYKTIQCSVFTGTGPFHICHVKILSINGTIPAWLFPILAYSHLPLILVLNEPLCVIITSRVLALHKAEQRSYNNFIYNIAVRTATAHQWSDSGKRPNQCSCDFCTSYSLLCSHSSLFSVPLTTPLTTFSVYSIGFQLACLLTKYAFTAVSLSFNDSAIK